MHPQESTSKLDIKQIFPNWIGTTDNNMIAGDINF